MKAVLKHALALLLVGFFVFYNFFYTGRYAEYPWWYEHVNDIDATYAANTVGLLNNSELTFVYHPGATIYALHGTVYRILALKDPTHQRLMHLRQVRDYNQAADVLETSTRTSRILTLLESVLFLIVFYFFLVRLGGNWFVAFLLTFYLGTSHAFLQHICMVRAEVLSLLFLFCGFYSIVCFMQKTAQPPAGWMRFLIPAGFFLGFAIFSKIQIGPPLVFSLALLVFYMVRFHPAKDYKDLSGKFYWFSLALALVNLAFMPWWALKRPAFLTPEFLSLMPGYWREVYGPAPESFFVPVFVSLMSLVAISAFFMVRRFIRVFRVFNLLIFGGILSVYLILLPVSMSFAQYVENTRRLVYAVFTNVLYGGILSHRVLNFETVEKIWNMHGQESGLLHINILYFVLLAAVLSGYRLFQKVNPKRLFYGLVLFIFGTGLTMDVLATMRSFKLYYYYAFYSLSFLALGLGMWLSLECGGRLYPLVQKFPAVFCKGAIVILGLHVFVMGFYLLSRPRADGKSSQDPLVEYLNTRTHAPPFWRIVDEAIRRINHAS